MPKMYDIVGQRFGRLVVIKWSENKNGRSYWLCKCDCGNEKEIQADSLISKRTKSCGCWHDESARIRITKHNLAHKERLYSIWLSMRDRCNNQNASRYKDYGYRGIKVCKEWDDYLVFRTWALNNGYTDELTIDRIDVNGNYEPSNCRWTTYKVQALNKRNNHLITINGKTKTMKEWSDILGISYSALNQRLRRGWTEEELLLPVGSKRKETNKGDTEENN